MPLHILTAEGGDRWANTRKPRPCRSRGGDASGRELGSFLATVPDDGVSEEVDVASGEHYSKFFG